MGEPSHCKRTCGWTVIDAKFKTRVALRFSQVQNLEILVNFYQFYLLQF